MPQKSTLPDDEKAALILKAKESILKKVFEKGVSKKQTAEELQALRNEVGKKESQGRMAQDVKAQTSPARVDEMDSQVVRDVNVKKPLGGAKEGEKEISDKESEMELTRMKEDMTLVKLSVKEDIETELLGACSNEKEQHRGFAEENIQKDIATVSSVQPRETQQSKRSKKNKKSRIPKVTEKTISDTEKLPTPEKVDSEGTSAEINTKSAMTKPDLDNLVSTKEQRMDRHTDDQSDSDVIKPSVGDVVNEVETSLSNVKGDETSEQSHLYLHRPEEPNSHIKEQIQLMGVTCTGKGESHLETINADESIDLSDKAAKCQSDNQPTAQSMAPDTQPDKKSKKGKKKKKQQPSETDSTNVAESKSLKDQQLHPKSARSTGNSSAESESPGVPESDTTTESWEEGEDGIEESQETVSNLEGTSSKIGKSLIRQECLEHDQQVVALVSMVRHIEVRLKQQQQQSVGRSLIALDDIIRQTETLDLELRDLEPAINKEVEAAEQLLKPQPKDIPLQLLLALEKDVRSLTRGYEAAKALSEGILQSLQDHRDSYKEAVTAEQKSLGGKVESLLSWLRETETQMNGGMAGMEKMEKAENDSCDQLTQQLSLCKELQSSLMARSQEVNNVVFDIQVFISERAQDLAPEQSRQLLGQLQQLQRVFHRASGQAQAWADALSAQREREEEWQHRERMKKEDRERLSAKEREVWKKMIESHWFITLLYFLLINLKCNKLSYILFHIFVML